MIIMMIVLIIRKRIMLTIFNNSIELYHNINTNDKHNGNSMRNERIITMAIIVILLILFTITILV